jgi:UDP:flavonoid glycosyltransferase YjiC (YdhE family)
MVDGKCPRLKIAMVAIGEVGHMIPLSKIAEECASHGHEIHFITNEDEWTLDKAKIFLEPSGAKVHYTGPADVVDRGILFRSSAYSWNKVPHMTL